jgi:pimeloyl-ACP methyl ester carboxylesterase
MHTDQAPHTKVLRRSCLAGLVSIVVCGCGDSADDRRERAPRPAAVPSGEVLGMFDVGDRELNLRCYGTGSPVVVFETAHGVDSGPYMNLARQVGAETRACVYDRANLGLSDPRSTTPDGLEVDKDLSALLAAAKVSPPYVFAGQVDGGALALLHAAEHPGDARGLVLLDAQHPGAGSAIGALIPERERRRLEALGQREEPLDLDRVAAQMQARMDDLPQVPTTLVTATRFDDLPSHWPREKIKRAWLRHQDRYATLIPGARHVTTETHQYDMWTLDPFPVLDAIRGVVLAARAQGG